MTLKTSADGGPTTSPGSPLYSSVVFTLGQSFLLFRLNIFGCKLNPILTFPPPGKMKDFFSRLCIVTGYFVSHGRRRRQQPRSSSSSPFPEDFRKGLCSPSGKDKLQLVPTGHGSLTGCLGSKRECDGVGFQVHSNCCIVFQTRYYYFLYSTRYFFLNLLQWKSSRDTLSTRKSKCISRPGARGEGQGWGSC